MFNLLNHSILSLIPPLHIDLISRVAISELLLEVFVRNFLFSSHCAAHFPLAPLFCNRLGEVDVNATIVD